MLKTSDGARSLALRLASTRPPVASIPDRKLSRGITTLVSFFVWLRSGGYIIMDQAEALTAIDVNSGRYVGKKNLEETITKINVEAAKEIVYQLRLRNIGAQ